MNLNMTISLPWFSKPTTKKKEKEKEKEKES
jgi:hypothetical protein